MIENDLLLLFLWHFFNIYIYTKKILLNNIEKFQNIIMLIKHVNQLR